MAPNSRTFKSCNLWGDWIICPAHPTGAHFDWDLLNFHISTCHNHSWRIFAVWKGALCCLKRPLTLGNMGAVKWCSLSGLNTAHLLPIVHPDSISFPVMWYTFTWASTWCHVPHSSSDKANFFHYSMIDAHIPIVGVFTGRNVSIETLAVCSYLCSNLCCPVCHCKLFQQFVIKKLFCGILPHWLAFPYKLWVPMILLLVPWIYILGPILVGTNDCKLGTPHKTRCIGDTLTQTFSNPNSPFPAKLAA